jgi:hypothetical protein
MWILMLRHASLLQHHGSSPRLPHRHCASTPPPRAPATSPPSWPAPLTRTVPRPLMAVLSFFFIPTSGAGAGWLLCCGTVAGLLRVHVRGAWRGCGGIGLPARPLKLFRQMCDVWPRLRKSHPTHFACMERSQPNRSNSLALGFTVHRLGQTPARGWCGSARARAASGGRTTACGHSATAAAGGRWLRGSHSRRRRTLPQHSTAQLLWQCAVCSAVCSAVCCSVVCSAVCRRGARPPGRPSCRGLLHRGGRWRK